jgi:hypothetical protein
MNNATKAFVGWLRAGYWLCAGRPLPRTERPAMRSFRVPAPPVVWIGWCRGRILPGVEYVVEWLA